MDDGGEARQKLRARLREQREQRSRGAASAPPAREAGLQDSILRLAGDDPSCVALAHRALQQPGAFRRRPQRASDARVAAPRGGAAGAEGEEEEEEEEEEGLPASVAP